MSNIATKLTYLNGTKQAIKQAINEDFEVIDDNTTFREYAEEISSNNAKYKDLIPKETKNATNTLDISNSSGLDKALVTQYGNTYQEGEPTPDTPQEIVNISGKSTLKDVGKNLFDKSAIVNQSIYTGSVGQVVSIGTNVNTFRYPIFKKTSNSITISASDTSATMRVLLLDNDNKILSTTAYASLPQTIDTSSCEYIAIFFDNTTITANANIQINEGTTATAYEPYQEQSFDLDLKSKNLFDKNNVRDGYRLTQDGYHVEAGYSATEIINVKPNTTYSTSWTMFWGACVCTYDKNDNFSRRIQNETSFTTTSTEYYIRACVENNMLSTAQIEENSTSTDYEPFYDINLCKIGDYKDRIYPLNGKWYLEKKIGKVVLDGSEYWQQSGYTNETIYSTYSQLNDYKQNSVFISNLFTYVSNVDGTTSVEYISAGGDSIRIGIFKSRLTAYTINEFKTWLSNNNVTIYYPLATSTETQITENNYPTLYNQLNNIKLFEGVNHITMTNESGLDVEFDITYYKDWKLD